MELDETTVFIPGQSEAIIFNECIRLVQQLGVVLACQDPKGNIHSVVRHHLEKQNKKMKTVLDSMRKQTTDLIYTS